MVDHARYHIKLNSGFLLKKKNGCSGASVSGLTTVSLNQTLVDLLAIKLGTIPRSKEARSAVTKQLQAFTKYYKDCGSHGLSRRLTNLIILFLVDNQLSDQYYKFHFTESDHDEVSSMEIQ